MLPNLRIVEGVAGVWFYHLTDKESNAHGLCGANTMSCGVPLDRWGFKGHPGHISYGYCAKCAQLAGMEPK